MKKLISFVSVLCILAVLLCGCGKKKDKNNSESTTTDGTTVTTSQTTESQISIVEGIDEVAVNEIDEDELPVVGDVSDTVSTSSNNNSSSNA